MKKTATLITVILLGACNEMPPGVYYNRGDPETLLDRSSETVSFSLRSHDSLNEMETMLRQDPPTRAVLGCRATDKLCGQAKALLDAQGVASEWDSSGKVSGVSLEYDRVMARDCENRYIDNSINPYNLQHPTYGCSLIANAVQMVSDKRQFANPGLLDYQDGEKAQQAYRLYETPPKKPSTVPSWTVQTSGTSR